MALSVNKENGLTLADFGELVRMKADGKFVTCEKKTSGTISVDEQGNVINARHWWSSGKANTSGNLTLRNQLFAVFKKGGNDVFLQHVRSELGINDKGESVGDKGREPLSRRTVKMLLREYSEGVGEWSVGGASREVKTIDLSAKNRSDGFVVVDLKGGADDAGKGIAIDPEQVAKEFETSLPAGNVAVLNDADKNELMQRLKSTQSGYDSPSHALEALAYLMKSVLERLQRNGVEQKQCGEIVTKAFDGLARALGFGGDHPFESALVRAMQDVVDERLEPHKFDERDLMGVDTLGLRGELLADSILRLVKEINLCRLARGSEVENVGVLVEKHLSSKMKEMVDNWNPLGSWLRWARTKSELFEADLDQVAQKAKKCRESFPNDYSGDMARVSELSQRLNAVDLGAEEKAKLEDELAGLEKKIEEGKDKVDVAEFKSQLLNMLMRTEDGPGNGGANGFEVIDRDQVFDFLLAGEVNKASGGAAKKNVHEAKAPLTDKQKAKLRDFEKQESIRASQLLKGRLLPTSRESYKNAEAMLNQIGCDFDKRPLVRAHALHLLQKLNEKEASRALYKFVHSQCAGSAGKLPEHVDLAGFSMTPCLATSTQLQKNYLSLIGNRLKDLSDQEARLFLSLALSPNAYKGAQKDEDAAGKLLERFESQASELMQMVTPNNTQEIKHLTNSTETEISAWCEFLQCPENEGVGGAYGLCPKTAKDLKNVLACLSNTALDVKDRLKSHLSSGSKLTPDFLRDLCSCIDSKRILGLGIDGKTYEAFVSSIVKLSVIALTHEGVDISALRKRFSLKATDACYQKVFDELDRTVGLDIQKRLVATKSVDENLLEKPKLEKLVQTLRNHQQPLRLLDFLVYSTHRDADEIDFYDKKTEEDLACLASGTYGGDVVSPFEEDHNMGLFRDECARGAAMLGSITKAAEELLEKEL